MARSREVPSRNTFRSICRADEESVIAAIIDHARADASDDAPRITALASELISLIRDDQANGTWQFKRILQDYDLSTDEGLALMCLAEALIRVPDTATADHLIADKLGGLDWHAHAGAGRPLAVNAAAWGLTLGQHVVADQIDPDRWQQGQRTLFSRLGARAVRAALNQAMQAMGRVFVFAETIDEAIKKARAHAQPFEHHSFDMLGEAACTPGQAEHYFQQYRQAIDQLNPAASALTKPSISVKLSALHPTYLPLKRERIMVELYPRLLSLCRRAMAAGLDLCLDAEETERLELSLDLLEKLLDEPSLRDWEGLGLAVQAYQKRAYPLLQWLVERAAKAGRRLHVRLVKGAYWDSEIKACQVAGLRDFPVFTRKVSTDISFLACARLLLEHRDRLYPCFASHNAQTLASVMVMAGAVPRGFEIQRLHGMGEIAHRHLGRNLGVVSRIYAPIGARHQLLPYLVRRLLENGANSSFVNQVAAPDANIEHLTHHPVAVFGTLNQAANPAIARPPELYEPHRRNSEGLDFSDRPQLSVLQTQLAAARDKLLPMMAGPMLADPGDANSGRGPVRGTHRVRNPSDPEEQLGEVSLTTAEQARQALRSAHDFAPRWAAEKPADRAELLRRVADKLQANKPALMTLCIREAGKTIPDAEAEVREAIDYCRYYAALAESLADPLPLPGSVGELNELSWHGRGPFLCISPWNFPLAIFCGQAMAALVSGNPVLLKPAEQTTLIAAFVTRLCHQAGVPGAAMQLLPGDGQTLGEALLPCPELKGVAFTGSCVTAHAIQRKLADRVDEVIPLIAETGGQNAMIVDSTALPEQVVRDVLVSAFGSAGQRCSCLRLLYLQKDIADEFVALLKAAMTTLEIGDPWHLATDVGPVISPRAAQALTSHIDALRAQGCAVFSVTLPPGLSDHRFVPPTLIELADSRQLEDEVFGPVLHVVRYAADQLDEVIDAINATGFGLTLGIHSRIDAVCRYISARVRAGNIYINRAMTGAVVGSQPFGGQGRSGTGFKAGGPHYLYRFMSEKCISIDTTAAGGNASLLGKP